MAGIWNVPQQRYCCYHLFGLFMVGFLYCSMGGLLLTYIRLTFVATTVLSALHIRGSSRSDTAPPPNMAGV
jgi:hypothetical protein